MNEDNLSPCPFCGTAENLKIHEYPVGTDGTVTYYLISHGPFTRCGASMLKETKEEAIEAWNNRHKED